MGYLYSVYDVAEALGVHPETVRRWRRTGKLKTLGGLVLGKRYGYVMSAEQVGSFIVSNPLYYKRFFKLWENTIAALKILSTSEQCFKEGNALTEEA